MLYGHQIMVWYCISLALWQKHVELEAITAFPEEITFFLLYSCTSDEMFLCSWSCVTSRQITPPTNTSLGRLDGSMEPANEILESASHDRPLVAQTYSAAVTKGTYVPSSPTRHGKEKAGNGAESASACCFILDGCVSSSASTLSLS